MLFEMYTGWRYAEGSRKCLDSGEIVTFSARQENFTQHPELIRTGISRKPS